MHHSHALELKMYDPRARDALAPVCRAESMSSQAIRIVVVQRRVRSVSVIVDAWWAEPASSVIARCGDDTPDGAHGAGRGPVESAYDPGEHKMQDEERVGEYVPIEHPQLCWYSA